MSEIDSYYVLCPYCQNECGDFESFDNSMDDNSVYFECDNCNKKFTGSRVVTVDYRTKRDCDMNGEEHEAGDYHCTKCDIYNPCFEKKDVLAVTDEQEKSE